MSTDYNYDDQGQFFPYFIFTISALITLPLTYSLIKPSDKIENTAPRIRTNYKPLEDDLIQGERKKQWRRERRLKRIVTTAIGYVVMAMMLYLIAVTKASTPKVWDPYDILGVSLTSSESQIKKRYRDLSRTLHPDKAIPDQSKNETAETVNDHWVEVSKAFKSLTDEEVRNNYIQYGHPDGKQGFSIGIALPTFIITEGNGKYVLLVYGALLGVLLPYTVGKWWYGTQRLTKEKVLLKSASNLFREYKDNLGEGDVLNNLSGGQEFDDVLAGNNADSGLGRIEQNILKTVPEQNATSAGLGPTDVERLQSFDGSRRKAAALLWAYLGRVKLGSTTNDREKYEVAPIAHKLIDALIPVALAYGNTGPLLSTYHASQCLIQALPPTASPLLQLPYMTPDLARAIEASAGGQGPLSVSKFMSLPEFKRRKICTESPTPSPAMSPAEYESALAVAHQFSFLQVEKAFFKVTGERFVTPGSLVQLVVKARVIPPGTMDIPAVDPLDLEDIDPDEGDIDQLLGRKAPRRKQKVLDEHGNKKDVEEDNEDTPLVPPLTFAPYFARDHSPRWHIFLADSKMGKIAVPPFTMTTFNKPPFKEVSAGDLSNPSTPVLSGPPKGLGGHHRRTSSFGSRSAGTRTVPTFNVQTFKMQFQAPPHPGKYAFTMHVVCDSYVGTDSQQDVVLEVETAEKAAAMTTAEEDDISEPEEDSLAGQMRAMQSGGISAAAAGGSGKKKALKRKPGDEEDEDDEDESGTDEEEDDTSETDTETEDEDE